MTIPARISAITQLLILALVLVVLPIVIALLPIRTVSCQIASAAHCPVVLVTALQTLTGRSLLLTQADSTVSELSLPAGYTLVQSRKQLFSELQLTFQEEQALFQITCPDCAEPLVVGEHRHILYSQPTDLASFSVPHSQAELLHGSQLNESVFQPLETIVLSLYKQGRIFQNGVWSSPEEIRLEIADTPTVLVSTQDIEGQMLALAAILEGETTSQLPAPASEIDLRFKMPVIRTR